LGVDDYGKRRAGKTYSVSLKGKSTAIPRLEKNNLSFGQSLDYEEMSLGTWKLRLVGTVGGPCGNNSGGKKQRVFPFNGGQPRHKDKKPTENKSVSSRIEGGGNE